MPMLSSCLSCVATGRMFTALRKTPCVSRFSEAFPDSDEDPAEVITKADCIALYGMKLFERESSAEKAESTSSSTTSCHVISIITVLILSLVLLALIAKLCFYSKSNKTRSAKKFTSEQLVIFDGGAPSTGPSGVAESELANV